MKRSLSFILFILSFISLNSQLYNLKGKCFDCQSEGGEPYCNLYFVGYGYYKAKLVYEDLNSDVNIVLPKPINEETKIRTTKVTINNKEYEGNVYKNNLYFYSNGNSNVTEVEYVCVQDISESIISLNKNNLQKLKENNKISKNSILYYSNYNRRTIIVIGAEYEQSLGYSYDYFPLIDSDKAKLNQIAFATSDYDFYKNRNVTYVNTSLTFEFLLTENEILVPEDKIESLTTMFKKYNYLCNSYDNVNYHCYPNFNGTMYLIFGYDGIQLSSFNLVKTTKYTNIVFGMNFFSDISFIFDYDKNKIYLYSNYGKLREREDFMVPEIEKKRAFNDVAPILAASFSIFLFAGLFIP